jgi:hypothetical protein
MKIFSNFIDENDPVWDILKTFDKKITLFYDRIPNNIEELKINPYNFIMLHEPNEFFGIHDWVLNNNNLFTGILTWNNKILKSCDNSILFYHSANHFESNYIEKFNNLNYNKKFEISFLSGTKNLVEGHILRQNIFNIKEKINIPKKWYYVLEDFNWENYQKTNIGRPGGKLQAQGKQILFDETMFTIVVENVNYDNWFTEKISDAFNTKTIPIYWGCPNISDFGYDERGIIRFKNIKDLIYIVNNLTEKIYYDLMPYIDYNYNIAKKELKSIDKLLILFAFTKIGAMSGSK